MEPLGEHLIIELKGCDFDKLNDPELIIETFKRAVKEANMTLLKIDYYVFEPQGLTVYCVLSESHISCHNYPEHGIMMLDIFTCGDKAKPEKAYNVIKEVLSPESEVFRRVKRGGV